MGQTTILDNILQDDDISWQSMIMEAVKSNEMNPWDVDITALAAEFINRLKNLQEMNFKLSGKVVLASALLLKLKSQKFVSEDMTLLDQLISSVENADEELEEYMGDDSEFGMDESEFDTQAQQRPDSFVLQKRTPQPRKRKVSVYDLIEALEQAIEVNKRKQIRNIPIQAPQVHIPKVQFDIMQSMDTVHIAIQEYFQKQKHKPLSFSQLIPSKSRNDQIFTFIPLLHLRNAQKIDLHQEEHFEDFFIEQPSVELQRELGELK